MSLEKDKFSREEDEALVDLWIIFANDGESSTPREFPLWYWERTKHKISLHDFYKRTRDSSHPDIRASFDIGMAAINRSIRQKITAAMTQDSGATGPQVSLLRTFAKEAAEWEVNDREKQVSNQNAFLLRMEVDGELLGYLTNAGYVNVSEKGAERAIAAPVITPERAKESNPYVNRIKQIDG
jgi:hypothetical protein